MQWAHLSHSGLCEVWGEAHMMTAAEGLRLRLGALPSPFPNNGGGSGSTPSKRRAPSSP